MISTSLLLFGAVFETTTNLHSNTMHALLDHTDQQAALRADPALIPTAVEEFLRYDSPVQVDARTVLHDTDFAGTHLKAGQVIVMLLGAANHDPDLVEQPDTLDVTRPQPAHLSFASGIHFCLGAHLARLETQIVLEQLLGPAYLAITRPMPPRRRPGIALRGLAHLPLTLHP
jgi:cytochrome P450